MILYGVSEEVIYVILVILVSALGKNFGFGLGIGPGLENYFCSFHMFRIPVWSVIGINEV